MDEYFYKTVEIENYAQLPLDFIKSDFYEELNLGVKMLYVVLLDRLGLSAKNEWVDSNGRIYVIYTEENIEKDLHIGIAVIVAGVWFLFPGMSFTVSSRVQVNASHHSFILSCAFVFSVLSGMPSLIKACSVQMHDATAAWSISGSFSCTLIQSVN